MEHKNLKGASPLGGLLLAGCIILIAAFGMFGFMGTIQRGTGSAINGTLAAQYNAILGPQGNMTLPTQGVFNNWSSATNYYTSHGGVASTGILALGAVAGGTAFNPLLLITSLVNTMFVTPLQAVGVQAEFAWTIALMLFTGIVVLLIASALLIFNLI